jgi:hypothetical protein
VARVLEHLDMDALTSHSVHVHGIFLGPLLGSHALLEHVLVQRMMAMGENGCYVQLVRASVVHAYQLKVVTHASEAIHGTQTRAPFPPLQKSHTLKKARIKEGLFIGPPTCDLLSNST